MCEYLMFVEYLQWITYYHLVLTRAQLRPPPGYTYGSANLKKYTQQRSREGVTQPEASSNRSPLSHSYIQPGE